MSGLDDDQVRDLLGSEEFHLVIAIDVTDAVFVTLGKPGQVAGVAITKRRLCDYSFLPMQPPAGSPETWAGLAAPTPDLRLPHHVDPRADRRLAEVVR
ncbi:hypothetical protein ACWGIV_12610 [Streptomyces sp. NPDC054844]